MQVLRLSVEDIYGGMIPERAKEDASLPILAASIAKHGLLQPIIVQQNEDAGRYKLVCGARRLAACRMLGKKTIDALLLSGDRMDAAACFMEEDMTRKPISFLESAGLFARPGIMSRCILPPQTATRYTRMLALDEQTRQAASALSLEQAEPLLLISGAEQRLEAAQTIAQRNLTHAGAAFGIAEHRRTGKSDGQAARSPRRDGEFATDMRRAECTGDFGDGRRACPKSGALHADFYKK